MLSTRAGWQEVYVCKHHMHNLDGQLLLTTCRYSAHEAFYTHSIVSDLCLLYSNTLLHAWIFICEYKLLSSTELLVGIMLKKLKMEHTSMWFFESIMMLKGKFCTVCWTLVTSTVNISTYLLLQTHVRKTLVSTGT